MFRLNYSSIKNSQREKVKSTHKLIVLCIFLISFVLFGCQWLPGGYAEITIDQNGINYHNNNDAKNNDELIPEEDSPPIPDEPEPSTEISFTDSIPESGCPCDLSGNPVDDPYVDIIEITADSTTLYIILKAAYLDYLESVYSFALLIHIVVDGNYHSDYIKEKHAGNKLSGQQDPTTGQIVEGTEGQISLDTRADGSLKVSITDFIWPVGSEVEIKVESFHMADSSSNVHMDTFNTGPFAPFNGE